MSPAVCLRSWQWPLALCSPYQRSVNGAVNSARWSRRVPNFLTPKLEALGQLTGGIAHDFNEMVVVFFLGDDHQK
jgi:hypothetical protein